jgi:hypothetical protein
MSKVTWPLRGVSNAMVMPRTYGAHSTRERSAAAAKERDDKSRLSAAHSEPGRELPIAQTPTATNHGQIRSRIKWAPRREPEAGERLAGPS